MYDIHAMTLTRKFRFSSAAIFFLLVLLVLSYQSAFAQTEALNSVSGQSPVAVAVEIRGDDLAYGDLIDYDSIHDAYVLSSVVDDAYVFGVAVENPPAVLEMRAGDIPVVRSGSVLVNVTLENGAIAVGDSLVASSIAGKAMRASETSQHIIGTARESFDGTGTTTLSLSDGTTVPAGTVAVQLGDLSGAGATASNTASECVPAWKCVPFGILLRYALAALVAFGSVYLGFRTFMADAVNGVISVGRNPMARGAIQGMVVFNAVLAAALSLAGLIAGVVILFIQI